MCTDFTNLNKACPKDFYPLLCLGRLVDVWLILLEGNGQYHLRATDWRNMEIYVDDMLVKSKVRSEHLGNLKETFTRLRDNRLKLNP
ncbi:hypothetical protein LIER_07554 [Lithospermum erythrorhizon]|uniref:Uncharacterized protein n=1 Tax=Lithospermum erythrorhizon TaxID=34254 RepID=A0AAV3P8Z7_LITER